MIYKDLFECKNLIQKNKTITALAVVTKEEFIRDMATEELLPIYKKSLNNCTSTHQIEAAACSPSFLFSHFAELSLLQEKKLLIIHQAQQLSKESQQLLSKELEKQNPSYPVFLTATTVNHKLALYQTLLDQGILFEIEEIKKWEVEKITERWVVEKAKELKLKIAPQIAKLLIGATKESFTSLKNELDKLSLDPENLQKNCGEFASRKTATEAPWQIADHLMKNELPQACKQLFSLIDEGESCIGMVYQIRRFIQRQLLYLSLLEQQNGQQLLLKRFPNINNYTLQKIIQDSSRFSKKKLLTTLAALDKLEWRLKDNSSGCDECILLSQLIFANS